MPFRGHSTVRLPQSLLDELEAQDGQNRARPGASKSKSRNRKAERKADRQLAKQRKAHFFSNRPTGSKRDVEAVDPPEGGHQSKKQRVSKEPLSNSGHDSESKTAAKKKQPQQSLRPTVIPENISPKLPRSSASARSVKDKEEDAYIALLEKKLGVDKRRTGKTRYGAAFENDGLLDILLDLDETSDTNGELHQSSSDDDAEGWPNSTDNDSAEEEWPGFSEEFQENDSGSNDEIQSAEIEKTSISSRYIPPQLRRAQQLNNESSLVDLKLNKTLKGLLNRLTEQNMDSILKEIEGLYRVHRRHDITATLTKLVIEGTCSHSTLLDSYVALHAGLVACLHKIVGVEIAAYFVQTIVASFESYYAQSKDVVQKGDAPTSEVSEDLPGKECSNLLVFLSELYNFHVISCGLMYDIIRLILEGDLKELDVELILKLARGSGTQLRQDDPAALIDIAQIVQSKLGVQGQSSSRTRFMVETLNNLKTNKAKKQASLAGNESKERIAKFVSGIGKRYQVHAHEALRISLEDLHQADVKGKWWLVGAAWGGDPLTDLQNSRDDTQVPTQDDSKTQLLALARKQGMNTDVRRSIFLVLMTSDDYVDACERLSQLSLNEVQQREIIRVVLHCCGNERSYNPYYTLIGQHLCRQSHNHKITLQYCLWDFLRSLGESNIGGAEMSNLENDRDDNSGFDLDHISSTRISNVAKAYGWWVAKDSLSLTILKSVDFIDLTTKGRAFFRHLFTQIFISTQDTSEVPTFSVDIKDVDVKRDAKALELVLVKALRVPAVAQGISHFLAIMAKTPKSDNDRLDNFLRWSYKISNDVLLGSL